MDAAILGLTGPAIFIGKNNLKIIHWDGIVQEVLHLGPHSSHMLTSEPEPSILQNVGEDQLVHILELRRKKDDALMLTLMAIDALQDDTIKYEALELLNEKLADDKIFDYIESILYAISPPESADIDGALKLCKEKQEKVITLLRELKAIEPYIREVQSAWDNLSTRMFDSSYGKDFFKSVLIRKGIFRDLVVAMAKQIAIDSFLFNSMLNREIQSLPNHRQILRNWAGSMNLAKTKTPDPELDLEREDDSRRTARSGRKRKRRSIDREELLSKVESQKALIINEMQRNDHNKAKKIAEELISFQLEMGRPIHIVKSLCDLAMEAKRYGSSKLQYWFSRKGLDILQDDGWTWAQYADALYNLNNYEEALQSYDKAYEFGAGVVAKAGRAEVLKALNRLPEALDAFDQIISQHPEDVVAKNGRAVVLAYTGRYDEALSSLPTGTPLTMNDWISYHIRGMIHFRLSDFDIAQNIFQRGINENLRPRQREFFSLALALLFITNKEYAKAGELLQNIESPDLQITANVLKVHAFGSHGDTQSARKAYEKIPSETDVICVEFKEELRRKYIDDEEPMYDEDWLNESAISCFYRLAA